jgi:hypothetical protein
MILFEAQNQLKREANIQNNQIESKIEGKLRIANYDLPLLAHPTQ